MKYPIVKIAIVLLVGLAIGCNDDEAPEDPYNIELGDFYLLPESVAQMPYLGKVKAIYVDSLGEEVTMDISETALTSPNGEASFYKYDVYTTGDSVKYTYGAQEKSFELDFEALDLNYSLTLRTTLSINDPTAREVLDGMTLARKEQGNYYYSFAFYDVIDVRNSQSSPILPYNFGPITFWDKTFDVALANEILAGLSIREYFNYTDGLLAFEDHDGRVWRFDRFED